MVLCAYLDRAVAVAVLKQYSRDIFSVFTLLDARVADPIR